MEKPLEFLKENLFPISVIGFAVYNTAVIEWELKKPNSTECHKCARTREIFGIGLAAWAGFLMFQK